MHIPLTQIVQNQLATCLKKGDRVVDATLGNGNDSLWLCNEVLPGGHIYGFDIQNLALENTYNLIQDSGHTLSSVTLSLACHSKMDAILPSALKGEIALFMFNLGYLPGSGNKDVTTTSTTTIAALNIAREWLAPRGFLSIVLYPGHEAGKLEAIKVQTWANMHYTKEKQQLTPTRGTGPEWLLLKT